MPNSEPERRILTEDAHIETERLVTMEHVGWLLDGRGFYHRDDYQLGGEFLPDRMVPVWVESPGE